MKKRIISLLALFVMFLFTSCALEGVNVLGPAGGYTFYDKGSYSDGWRYLECAPENTLSASWYDAARLCANYSYGGYDDWFLPSIDELHLVYANLVEHSMGKFVKYGEYWSSSEEDPYALVLSFYSGSRKPWSKPVICYVRAIRRF